MNKKTYDLEYNGDFVARVEILDSEKSRQAIREMVEFWCGWERRLDDTDGDYTSTFLKQVACYIARNRVRPDTDPHGEGYYPLNGDFDIKILNWEPLDVDEYNVGIKEIFA